MNTGSFSNNISNDGIACENDEYVAYNENASIFFASASGDKEVIPYDGYFINIEYPMVYFALKTDGFSLYQYNVHSKQCQKLVLGEIKWVHQIGNKIYYTCDESNFLWVYDIQTCRSELLLKKSCNYLCIIGCKIFFSNWSCDKHLWVYDISKKESHEVLDIDVAWLNVVDSELLVFRSWHNRKTYLYSIEAKEKKLLNSDGANYLHYRDGYIYYVSRRLGGLWKQSVNDKSYKCCIYGENVRRVNSTEKMLLFQNAQKKTIKINFAGLLEFPNLNYIEMIVTTRCNMHCHNCSNGIPYIEKSDISYADFCAQLNKLLCRVSFVRKFQIHGGEPFLNKELPEIIELANSSQKLLNIRLVTNGTVIPSIEIIQALKGTRVTVAISSYCFNESTREKLIHLLAKNGIKYILYGEQEWYSFDDCCKGQNNFEECPINSFPCYYNGKLYVCSRICHLYSKLHPNCYVDLENLDIDLLEALKLDQLKRPCIDCNISKVMVKAGT